MENVRGLVLASLDYREKEKILRIYTKEKGKLSLIIRQKPGNHLLTTPLSEGEFIFNRQRGNLHSVKDASLINPRLHLRKTLSILKSAGAFLQVVIHSQLDEKPTPCLYELLTSYLDHLPKSPNHALLIASFKLKLLKYEGLIGESPLPSYTDKEWQELLSFIEIRSYTTLYQTQNPYLFESLAERLCRTLDFYL